MTNYVQNASRLDADFRSNISMPKLKNKNTIFNTIQRKQQNKKKGNTLFENNYVRVLLVLIFSCSVWNFAAVGRLYHPNDTTTIKTDAKKKGSTPRTIMNDAPRHDLLARFKKEKLRIPHYDQRTSNENKNLHMQQEQQSRQNEKGTDRSSFSNTNDDSTVVSDKQGRVEVDNKIKYSIEGDVESATQRLHYLHEGRVLTEFLDRVLSRSVSSSSVLVLYPESEPSPISSQRSDHFNSTKNNTGGHVVQTKAEMEGHDVYTITQQLQATTENSIDGWWNYQKEHHSQNNLPSWFILVFITPPSNARVNSLDSIISHATHFLQDATVTYMVLELKTSSSPALSPRHHDGQDAIQTLLRHQYKLQILASTRFYLNTVENKKPIEWGPNTLLTQRNFYQFLQDFHNTTEQHSVYIFATQGLDLAIPSRRSYTTMDNICPPTHPKTRNGRCGDYVDNETMAYETCSDVHNVIKLDFVSTLPTGTRNLYKIKEVLVQGMPDRLYRPNNDNSPVEIIPFPYETLRLLHEGYIYRPSVLMLGRYKQNTTITIANTNTALPHDGYGIELWTNHPYSPETSEAACIRILNGFTFKKIKKNSLFMGRRGTQAKHRVTCTTRIIPQSPEYNQQPLSSLSFRNSRGKSLNKPASKASTSAASPSINILSILIDPISRSEFQRSLPKTSAILANNGFANFTKYTVVGDNSGPNQSALFSGVPLEHRDGIKSSSSSQKEQNSYRWIWDVLRQDLGYATLKAEDGCVANSNMMQSINPNTTHGKALHELFCFDYERPNCLGSLGMSEHLISYAKQFITMYSSGKHKLPWAAFLSFVDTHEDTMTLGKLLDEPLSQFLELVIQLSLNTNMAILILSDHGLHYGPYFRTDPGRKERAEPILFAKLSASSSLAVGHNVISHEGELKHNENSWTTPYDVHETLLHLVYGNTRYDDRHLNRNTEPKNDNNKSALSVSYGTSLLRPHPQSRKHCHTTPGIPLKYCQHQQSAKESSVHRTQTVQQASKGAVMAKTEEIKSTAADQDIIDNNNINTCQLMPLPPSIMSYYSDLYSTYQNNDATYPKWPSCTKPDSRIRRPLQFIRSHNRGEDTNNMKISKGELQRDHNRFTKEELNLKLSPLEPKCQCATNEKDWHGCTVHPFDAAVATTRKQHLKAPKKESQLKKIVNCGKQYKDLHFAMMVCDGHDNDTNKDNDQKSEMKPNEIVVALDIEITRNKKLVERYKSLLNKKRRIFTSNATGSGQHQQHQQKSSSSSLPAQPPNILFLEIDSVSTQYAKRHLPKTRALLKKHGIIKINDNNTDQNKKQHNHSNKVYCPTGFCAVEFTKMAVVGKASIGNQAAALSGCMSNDFLENDFHWTCFQDKEKAKLANGKCLNQGMLKFHKSCILCEPGTHLVDSLKQCFINATHTLDYKVAKKLCCHDGFHKPSTTEITKDRTDLICMDHTLPERGLELFHRFPFPTWCPLHQNDNEVKQPMSDNANNNSRRGSNPWLFDIVEKLGYITFFGEEFCAEQSPYVIQGNVFATSADYDLSKLFCRLASRTRKVKGYAKWTSLYSVEDDTSFRPQPCIDGRPRQNFAFEYITQMWDAYPDVPKFAFLNAMAAHDYSLDKSRSALGAEAYDDHLSMFLASMLERKDLHARNTLIILRSDHGLQGGPNIVDYSFQREHPLPWTTMIVPEKMPGISIEQLHENRDKLVTGYDIYNSIRNRIDPYMVKYQENDAKTNEHVKNEDGDKAGLGYTLFQDGDDNDDDGDDEDDDDNIIEDDDDDDGEDDCTIFEDDDDEDDNDDTIIEDQDDDDDDVLPALPSWSYDLFTSPVPGSRTCFDARIPKQFCPCMNERIDMAPNFRAGEGF